MQFISATQIRSVLTFPLLIAALEAAHRRPKMVVQDALLGTGQGQYFVRHAVDLGRYMASKLITSFPGNLAGGLLPAVQAVFVLFDGTNGQPLAVLDGTEITYWRTAADSALGARILAPPEPATLLVVGAGGMSTRLVHAHLTARPSLRRVLVWNRTPRRAAEVAGAMEAGLAAGRAAEFAAGSTANPVAAAVTCEAVTDLAAAVREADLISTCTRSREPLISGAGLKPGAHLDLVGGYSPDTREADDEAMRRARVFVDCRESAFHGVGDILQPIANGAIQADDVRGDLYDLVPGRVEGRRSAADITLFKNAGGGHLDLMTAELILQRLTGRDPRRD
jgi:ornithine cyclodeaminase